MLNIALGFLLILTVLEGLIFLVYQGAGIKRTSMFLALMTLLALSIPAHGIITFLFATLTLASLIFSITALRQKLFSRPALNIIRKILPPISETEQEAINAGKVGWDGQIFSGKPDWNRLVSAPMPTLTDEEQAFIDGPVTELCRKTDAWKINHDWKIIPDNIIRYVCDQGFLGMIIPKKYGGLGFSAVAQSQIILKLTHTGGGVSYLVGVPNSLGPGELLIKYGTKKQKDHYLPRLASGKEIPCFALTGPTAGSDATSIPDTGVVCKGQWKGKTVLGMRLNFSKRYITLAPIATLIGLAFRLQDPHGLIGNTKDYGITCALIPRSTPGLDIGRRHLPIGDVFLNGPIKGEALFVPLSFIIGGQKMAGKGWRMLVNCLSAGRAVTLPSTAVAVAKRTVIGTSAYASLRHQFGISLNKFEGIQKPLARITGLAYIIDAARIQTIQSIDDGNQPSVASAIIKYHCTEKARQCILDAMDIHGGKAVMKGPGNYIAPLYESIPVAITVEGANIMTRNLMIFGQGAIRSHPYALKEMELAQAENNHTTHQLFDQTLASHLGFSLRNLVRSFVLGLFPASEVPHVEPEITRYYQHITHLSSVFAATADLAMLSLGAKLKFREMISARLGDLLSTLYLASMVLKQHKDNNYARDEWPIVQWELDHLLHEYQIAFDELIANFPNQLLAGTLKSVAFPTGRRFAPPLDSLEKQVANIISQDSSARQRLTRGVYTELSHNNPLATMNEVFLESLELAPLHKKLHTAIKDRLIPKPGVAPLIESALSNDLISAHEAERLVEFEKHVMEIINVDKFDESQLIRVSYEETSGDTYEEKNRENNVHTRDNSWLKAG